MSTTQTERPTPAQTVRAASYTPWQLAHMAGVSDPASLTSPGAEWLRARTFDALELIETSDPDDDQWDADDIRVYADVAVPIYTHQKWQVFTDLAAWQVDVEEWGAIEDMDKGASLALYVTAETLITALLADLDEVQAPTYRVILQHDNAADWSWLEQEEWKDTERSELYALGAILEVSRDGGDTWSDAGQSLWGISLTLADDDNPRDEGPYEREQLSGYMATVMDDLVAEHEASQPST